MWVAGLVAAGYSHSNASKFLERQDVRIIYRSRRTDLAAAMKRQSYAANDPIFDQFTHLGGKGSGTVYMLDQETHDLVSAITITEVKDLTPTLSAEFQHIFSNFIHIKGFHPSIANNHTMIAGTMKAIGWGASMEQGQAFGTYVPFTSVNPAT